MTVYQVDSFTDAPFSGNPAAVCILSEPGDEAWMQRVAAEMNLSETAFVRPGGDDFSLRWFTPVTEVELCGHATLATAHVLWETGHLPTAEEARFHTASGLLTATLRDDEIELSFPARPQEEADAPAGLARALGAVPRYVGRTGSDYLVEAESEELVRGLTPDFTKLRGLPLRAVMVTSAVPAGRFDFVSRFFAPGMGIDEDPVTGAAHCCLGPFWSERLGKTELMAHQVSARGGVVRVRVVGDRVYLGGRAVTVMRGELLV